MSEINISQADLISAITNKIAEMDQGFNLNPRQFNTIISASQEIINSLRIPNKPAEANSGLTQWLASDDTGLSSLFLAYQLDPSIGEQEFALPQDSDDLGRCLRLFVAVPELKPIFNQNPFQSKNWRQLQVQWNKLETLYHNDKHMEVYKILQSFQ